MECPKGHKLRKKRHSDGVIAKSCPDGSRGGECIQLRNCPFNHDIKNCYYCLACEKHYNERFRPWRIA